MRRPKDVARYAKEIYVQAGLTDAMPPANVSFMEPEERSKVIRWFRGVGGTQVAAN